MIATTYPEGVLILSRRWILITLVFMVAMTIALTGTVFGDTGVPAVPKIQGLTTGTTVDATGTVTETDSGAWSLTNDPPVYSYSATASGFDLLTFDFDLLPA
jgi:hypothetical protein